MDLDRRNFLKYAGIAGIAGGLTLANAKNAFASTVLTNDYVQSDAIHAPTGRSATIVIAASDSSAAYKAQADYVCDGTTDDDTIQTAVTYVGTLGGGIVMFLRGTYLLNKAVYVPSNVTIQGEGKYSGTKLKIANGISSVLTQNAASGQKNIVVASVTGFKVGQDITVNDATHMTYGAGDSGKIAAINPDTNTITLTVNLYNSYTVANAAKLYTSYSGLLLETQTFVGGVPVGLTGSTYVTIKDIEIDGNRDNNTIGNYDDSQSAINMANAHHTTIKNCYLHDTFYGGFICGHFVDGEYDGSWYLLIENNDIANVTDRGCVHLHGVKHSKIIGNVLSGSDYGIYMGFSDDNIFIGNHISGCGDGYNITNCSRNKFIGDEILDSSARGIKIGITSGYTTIDNSFSHVTITTTVDEGIWSEADVNTSYDHMTIRGCGEACLQVGSQSAHTNISNNHIMQQAGGHAITASGTYAVIGDNNIIQTGGGSAIYISGQYATTVGNAVSNGTRVCIENHGTEGLISLNNVVCTNTTPITNDKSTTVVKVNSGYVTENTGTATITAGQTTVNVSHGLKLTPTSVILSPTTATAGKQYYVSAKAASTFTITIDSAAEADISFDWQAVV